MTTRTAALLGAARIAQNALSTSAAPAALELGDRVLADLLRLHAETLVNCSIEDPENDTVRTVVEVRRRRRPDGVGRFEFVLDDGEAVSLAALLDVVATGGRIAASGGRDWFDLVAEHAQAAS